MEVTFETKELRDVCTYSDIAEAGLPLAAARGLRNVIADLRASRFLDEFFLLQSIQIPSSEFKITLGDGLFAHLASAHRVIPMTEGNFDPSKVYRIRVLAIEGECDD